MNPSDNKNSKASTAKTSDKQTETKASHSIKPQSKTTFDTKRTQNK